MTTEKHCEDMEFDPAYVAVRMLENRGYEILARDWEREGERADIVARDGGEIVFAKIWPSGRMIETREFERELRGAAEAFDAPSGLRPRFDAVKLIARPGSSTVFIKHLINVFGTAEA